MRESFYLLFVTLYSSRFLYTQLLTNCANISQTLNVERASQRRGRNNWIFRFFYLLHCTRNVSREDQKLLIVIIIIFIILRSSGKFLVEKSKVICLLIMSLFLKILNCFRANFDSPNSLTLWTTNWDRPRRSTVNEKFHYFVEDCRSEKEAFEIRLRRLGKSSWPWWRK